MNTEEKKAQIERVYEVLNRKALDEIETLFHPDYVDHSPMGDFAGVEAFKQLVSGWWEALPDAHFEVSDIIVEGDLAAWRVRLTATNTGSLNGMPPTGRSIDVTGINMGRMSDDGRPIEHWANDEMLAMLQQLGIVPDLAAAPAG